MEKFYILEGTHTVEVLHTGKVNMRMSPGGTVPQVTVRRRGEEITIDRDELIVVKESITPRDFCKVILSTNNELNRFFFYVNYAVVNGMTLAEQSAYIVLKARRELVRALLSIGAEEMTKLNTKLQTLHLHQPLQITIDNYACDHAHDFTTQVELSEGPNVLILSALTGYPSEDPKESLFRMRTLLDNMSGTDKQKALDNFLLLEPAEVKDRVNAAEMTVDGRDEYLKKFALVQYLKFVRGQKPDLVVKQNLVLDPLWSLEWQYRIVRLSLLSSL
jgi:hypothetical protein